MHYAAYHNEESYVKRTCIDFKNIQALKSDDRFQAALMKEDIYRNNVFHIAAQYDSFNVCEILLNRLAKRSINQIRRTKNSDRWTPLAVCLIRNSVKCFELFFRLTTLPLLRYQRIHTIKFRGFTMLTLAVTS